MSLISNLNQTQYPTAYGDIFPVKTTESSFASTLASTADNNIQTTSSESDLLDLNVENPFYRPDKPSIKEFMDATGSTFEEAVDIIYGVIGSNADYRDWKKIMSASNPLETARKATGQNYTIPISIKSSTADSGSLQPGDKKVSPNLYTSENGDYTITASDGTILSRLSKDTGQDVVIKNGKRFGIDLSGYFSKGAPPGTFGATQSLESAAMAQTPAQVVPPIPQQTLQQTPFTAKTENQEVLIGSYPLQHYEKTISDALNAFDALKSLLQKSI